MTDRPDFHSPRDRTRAIGAPRRDNREIIYAPQCAFSRLCFWGAANTEVRVSARGKEVTDKNGVKRIEIDKLQTKIRVGDGNIRLKAPPSHTVTGEQSY